MPDDVRDGIDAGYGRAHVRITGTLGLFVVVFLLFAAGIVYVTDNGLRRVEASVNQVNLVADANAKETQRLLRESAEGHDLLACVVSLSMEDRAKLRYMTRADFQRFCYWMRGREALP